MSITEIQKMSNAERIQTMEALWEALCRQENEPISPDWHEDILSERLSKMESGQAKFYSLDEVKKRLLE